MLRDNPTGSSQQCLENPRPAGAELSLTEDVTSPFQAEPRQFVHSDFYVKTSFCPPTSNEKTVNSFGNWRAATTGREDVRLVKSKGVQAQKDVIELLREIDRKYAGRMVTLIKRISFV